MLIFKEKSKSSRITDKSIDDFVDFILVNKIFKGFALSFLGDWKKPITKNEDLKNKIEQNLNYDDIKNNEYLDEFIDLLGTFYNTIEDTLKDRRGQALEEIWSRIGPWNTQINSGKVIHEALVWNDDKKLSDSDIDFVHENQTNIELDECKMSAKNTLIHGISEKTKEKYNLMLKTKSIGIEQGKNTEAYIITLDSSIHPTKSLLRRYGFDDSIKILCRRDINNKF